MGHGDHLCLAFADDAEKCRVVTAYVLGGLRRGERVMYFADQSTPEQVLDYPGSRPGERAAVRDQATVRDVATGRRRRGRHQRRLPPPARVPPALRSASPGCPTRRVLCQVLRVEARRCFTVQ
ncbi:MEDS domain-containing protein [Streptomyces sp. NPDC002784]